MSITNQEAKKVLAVVTDLFFAVKIEDAAKRSGLAVTFVKTEENALELSKDGPLLIILDLNSNSLDSVDLITKLKNSEAKNVPLLAFVSHVQGELKQRAQEAGCNMVMARSAFSLNLQQILRRHAGSRSFGLRGSGG